MDWLRSCYRSEWHLFRDAHGVITRGRYYKCDPDTPFYPGVHNLGSRTWWDSNWPHVVELGESATAPHRWDSGMQPAVLPRNDHIVGDPACIAAGELIANALQPDQIDDGYPLACYLPPVALDPIYHRAASIWRCQIQLFYIRLIDLIYANDVAGATLVAREMFGPGPTITFHEGNNQFPTVLTIVDAAYAVAVVNGTTNYQQLALQAFYTVDGPTNIGIYGTNTLWYASSQRVHDLLTADGAAPGIAIMLAGHSYGGATVMNLAARYRHADANREIRYITYGGPKPGDTRMQGLLRLCQGIDLANTEDFVTVLPPSILLLQPVMSILGNFGLVPWSLWEPSPNTVLQEPSGALHINQYPTMDTATLIGFSQRALANLSLFGMPAHTAQGYIDRIMKRCRNETWPAKGMVGVAGFDRHFSPLGFKIPQWAFARVALWGAQAAHAKLGIGARGFDLAALGIGPEAIAACRLNLYGIDAGKGSVGIYSIDAADGSSGRSSFPVTWDFVGLSSAGILSARFGVGPQALPAAELGLLSAAAAQGELGLFSVGAAQGELGLSSFPITWDFVGLGCRALPSACFGIGPQALPAAELGLLSTDAAQGELGLFSVDAAQGAISLSISAISAGQTGRGTRGIPAAQIGVSSGPLEAAMIGLDTFDVAAGSVGLQAMDLGGFAHGSIALYGQPALPPIEGLTIQVNNSTSAGTSYQSAILAWPAGTAVAVLGFVAGDPGAITAQLNDGVNPTIPLLADWTVNLPSSNGMLGVFRGTVTTAGNYRLEVFTVNSVYYLVLGGYMGANGAVDVIQPNSGTTTDPDTGLSASPATWPQFAIAAALIVDNTSAAASWNWQTGFAYNSQVDNPNDIGGGTFGHMSIATMQRNDLLPINTKSTGMSANEWDAGLSTYPP